MREWGFWGGEEDDENDEEDENPLTENLKLAMPSSWDAASLEISGLQHLVKEEIQLHIG